LVRHAGAPNVRVFGSVAPGEDGLDSDIDLLVDYDSSQGLFPIVRLTEKLETLLGEGIDIAPVDILRPEVASPALSEAVPL